MNELLFYAKVILFVVLVYDVGILFRKPEKDSKIVTLDILKAKKTDTGGKISIEWYGWLMEKELPDCEVTDAILEEFKT